jgi:hypothetical protein
VFDYIERFYNLKRRHSTIGHVSPMEFEPMLDWLKRLSAEPAAGQQPQNRLAVVMNKIHVEVRLSRPPVPDSCPHFQRALLSWRDPSGRLALLTFTGAFRAVFPRGSNSWAIPSPCEARPQSLQRPRYRGLPRRASNLASHQERYRAMRTSSLSGPSHSPRGARYRIGGISHGYESISHPSRVGPVSNSGSLRGSI